MSPLSEDRTAAYTAAQRQSIQGLEAKRSETKRVGPRTQHEQPSSTLRRLEVRRHDLLETGREERKKNGLAGGKYCGRGGDVVMISAHVVVKKSLYSRTRRKWPCMPASPDIPIQRPMRVRAPVPVYPLPGPGSSLSPILTCTHPPSPSLVRHTLPPTPDEMRQCTGGARRSRIAGMKHPPCKPAPLCSAGMTRAKPGLDG